MTNYTETKNGVLKGFAMSVTNASQRFFRVRQP